MINQETIQQIFDRANLVDIVGEQVHLRRVGTAHKGLCPFHAENTPSFQVTEQRYYCFGCETKGNIFDWTQETLGLTFPEAVRHLAALTGITVEEDTATFTAERLPVKECVAAAQRLFTARTHPAVTAFADQRQADLAGWEVGYADGTEVAGLRAEGFTEETIRAAGLIGDKGYPTFKRRITFPIIDQLGRVRGFTARKLDGDDFGGKWINSPTSTWYTKSELAYGLRRATKPARIAKRIVLVEGPLDVYSMDTAGYPETVAPCGTAVTSDQLALFRRIVGEEGEIVIATDGDTAGIKVAMKVLELTGAEGLITVASMPAGMDPDDLRRTHGASALRAVMDARKPLVRHLLDLALDTGDTPEQRALGANRARKVLSLVTDDVLRKSYTDSLSERLGVTVTDIPAARTHTPATVTRIVTLEDKILRFAFSYPFGFTRFRPVFEMRECWRIHLDRLDAIPTWEGETVEEWKGRMRALGFTEGCTIPEDSDELSEAFDLADALEERVNPRDTGIDSIQGVHFL